MVFETVYGPGVGVRGGVRFEGSTLDAGGALCAERAAPARNSERGVAACADGPSHPGRADHSATAAINGEVIDSEPAGHSSAQGRGFDPITMTRSLQVSAEVPSAVGRIGQHGHRCGLTGQKLRSHCRIMNVDAAGLGQGAAGDQAGIGLDREMGFEPVLAAVHAFVGMTGLGIDGRKDRSRPRHHRRRRTDALHR